MLNTNKNLKVFYSIREVAEMTGISETTLRFWEKEFPSIKPKKAGRGVRQYQQEDIDQLRLIYHYVKEQGMTLEGARRALRYGKPEADKKVELIDRLTRVRNELQSLGRAFSQLE